MNDYKLHKYLGRTKSNQLLILHLYYKSACIMSVSFPTKINEYKCAGI